MTTPSAGGPLPLKPGESPELDEVVERIMEAIMAPNDLAPGIRRTLTTTLARYGDRRGEEERAKVLADAAALCEALADERETKADAIKGTHESLAYSVAAITWQSAADRIRSLAAAPSGDAKGTRDG